MGSLGTYSLRSAFVRNVTVLAGGKGSALLISLLLTPIISRLFSPADFGVVALLITVSNLIGDVSTLNYQLAIVLPKSIRKSVKVLTLSKTVLFFMVLLLFSIWTGLWVIGMDLPFEKTLGVWVWAIPFMVGIIGMGQVRNAALTRSKEFGVISRSDIGQAVATTGSRIGLGALFGSSVWGLASGYIFGLVVRLFMLRGRNNIYKNLNSTRSGWRQQLVVAREYRDFPLLNVPSALLSGVSAKLPVLMLGIWLGPAVVGLYAMADRLIRGPVDAVGIGLRRVYLQKVAELEASGADISRAFRKTSLVLLVTGVVPFGLLWMFGEQVISFVLGDQWKDTGRFAEILAPWFCAMWVSAIVAPTMTVRRKQGAWLILQIIVLISRAGSLGWCYVSDATAEYTLELFVVVNVALAVMMMIVGFVVSSSPNTSSANGVAVRQNR